MNTSYTYIYISMHFHGYVSKQWLQIRKHYTIHYSKLYIVVRLNTWIEKRKLLNICDLLKKRSTKIMNQFYLKQVNATKKKCIYLHTVRD